MTINLSCAGCGAKVGVESLIAAASQPCPHCGRLIIGGGLPRPAGTLEPRSPYIGQNEELERYRSTRLVSRSIWVDLLGIANILFGGLQVCCGIGIGLIPVFMHSPEWIDAVRQRGATADQIERMSQLSLVLIVVAGVMVVLSLAMIATGVGLLLRHRWARVFGLGIGALSMMAAIVGASQAEHCSTLVYGCYSVMVFGVLLSYPEDFRRVASESVPV